MDAMSKSKLFHEFVEKHRKDHKFQYVSRCRKDTKSGWYYNQPVICDASQDEEGHFKEMVVKTLLMMAVSSCFTVFEVGDDSILITNVNDPNKKMEIEAHINAISEDLLKSFQGGFDTMD